MTRTEFFKLLGSGMIWVIMTWVLIQDIVACSNEKEPQLYDIYNTVALTYANGDKDTVVICSQQIRSIDFKLERGDLRAYQYTEDNGTGFITTAYSTVRAFKVIKTDTIIQKNNSHYLRLKK